MPPWKRAARVAMLASVAALAVAVAPVPGSAAPQTLSTYQPRVFVVGDSLTLEMMDGCRSAGAQCLSGAFNRVGMSLSPRPSADYARLVREGMQVVAATPNKPSRVVFALGTNDYWESATNAYRWVGSLRRIVGPSTVVFWVTIDMKGARFANFQVVNQAVLNAVRADNRALVAAGKSGRSIVCDWRRYAQDNTIPHASDGVHYEYPQYALRADFYAGCVAGTPKYRPYRLR